MLLCQIWFILIILILSGMRENALFWSMGFTQEFRIFMATDFEKLIWYFKSLWYDIHEHAALMDVLAFFLSGFLRFLSHHMLNC